MAAGRSRTASRSKATAQQTNDTKPARDSPQDAQPTATVCFFCSKEYKNTQEHERVERDRWADRLGGTMHNTTQQDSTHHTGTTHSQPCQHTPPRTASTHTPQANSHSLLSSHLTLWTSGYIYPLAYAQCEHTSTAYNSPHSLRIKVINEKRRSHPRFFTAPPAPFALGPLVTQPHECVIFGY